MWPTMSDRLVARYLVLMCEDTPQREYAFKKLHGGLRYAVR